MGREWDEEIESNEDDFSSEDEIRSILPKLLVKQIQFFLMRCEQASCG